MGGERMTKRLAYNSINYLTRIITILVDSKQKYNYTELRETLGANSKLKNNLLWLEKNKIIIKKRDKYYINPIWLALKEGRIVNE